MSEDQDLLARIGQLAGHINLHKTQAPSRSLPENSRGSFQRPGPHRAVAPNRSSSWQIHRFAPYSRTRARPGKKVANPHRNKTLILNKTTNSSQSPKDSLDVSNSSTNDAVYSDADRDNSTKPMTSWVTKHDRHMQLINSSIFDKETQLRSKAIDQTRRQKSLQRNLHERNKIQRHLQSLSTSAHSSPHELTINGIPFHVLDGGSKLSRVHNESSKARLTPKETIVGGVKFLRSKNGNLYRSGFVKAQRRTGKVRKISEPCKRFSTTGQCLRGPLCPYIHDPSTVAICKDFLQKGTCAAGTFCDLSHDPSPERVPACLHFLRGKCSNSPCRYAHVRVNPSAPVCRPFAVLGYCSKGAQCNERHVHECPDYAEKAVCHNKGCHLPHIDRAGQIRKLYANMADTNKSGPVSSGDDNNDSDLQSEEEDYDEIDSDDVDSDGLDDEFIQLSSHDLNNHALSAQQDFIEFDSP